MRCIVVVVALLVGCTFSDNVAGEGEGEGEGEGRCPAAGPCEAGQVADDHGLCPDDGTWTPCVTVAVVDADGSFCGLELNAGTVPATPCPACAERWRDIDLGRTGIRCPDLPAAGVVAAD